MHKNYDVKKETNCIPFQKSFAEPKEFSQPDHVEEVTLYFASDVLILSFILHKIVFILNVSY